MKRLFAAAAVAPLCFAASQAYAQTTVSTATTTPLSTSASGNITVTSAGSVIVNSGNAVTIDSNNTLTNDGSIIVRNATTGTAVHVDVPAGGRASTITLNGNTGADDTQVSTDADNDGDLDGPFAADGTARYGVRLTGPGVFTGNVVLGANGTIGVKGVGGSSGILVESGLVGNLTQDGQIAVLGNDTYGMRVTGAVTGDILASGNINVTGERAVGIAVDGPVTGQFKLDSNISTTGFREVGRRPNADLRGRLDADDLLLGGPAVRVSNSISRGVLLYAPIGNSDPNDTDEDDDGIEDATQTGTATISQFGSAPGLLIGSASNITLGNVGTGPLGVYGLAIRGRVLANGVNDGVSATAVQIGGLGGTVNTTGGVLVRGSVAAAANLADATGLRLGAGAQVPRLLVEGQVSAETGGNATTTPNSRAIHIEAGASVSSLDIHGSLIANSAGPTGNAAAVLDSSGSLTSIVVAGNVTAALQPATGATTAAAGLATAFDLRANTTGVNIVQKTVNTGFAPQVFGAVLFGTGSGSDRLDLQSGSLVGDVSFGGGSDVFNLTNGALFGGSISKGAGSLAVDVSAGQLSLGNTNSVALSSLNVGSTSTLYFLANPAATDPANRNGRFDVAGTATLQSDSKIHLRFNTKLAGSESFTVIQAATLTNLGVTTELVGGTPFIYRATVRTTPTSAIVDVNRRTTEDLGLSGGRAAAFEAFYTNFDSDQAVLAAVFSKTDQAGFNGLYNQFLPDYSGGVFQSVALGARGIMQAQAEQPRDMPPGEPRSWLQEISIGISQDSPSEVTYRSNGFGVAGGYEIPFGANGGMIGLSAAFTSSDIRDQYRSFGSVLAVNSFMAGGYWRDKRAGLMLDASVNAGYAWVDSNREVISESAGGVRELQRNVLADWSGVVASARFGASYTYDVGPYFFRPDAILDYIYLSESGYTESGGGSAVDLQVDSRSTYEAGAEAGVTVGARFGRTFRWGPELRIAYRTTLAGGLAETTARFASLPGQPFVLSSIGADESRLIIRAALRGSGAYSNVALEAGGEIGDLYRAYLARLVIRFLF